MKLYIKKYLIFLLVYTALLLSCKQKENTNNNTSCSYITEGKNGIEIYNEYYQSIPNNKILKVEEKSINQKENLHHFKISPVYPKSLKNKWIIECEGSEFEVNGNLLTNKYKEENKENTFNVFSLENGNKLIDYTYDRLDVAFSNEMERRIIGIYSKNASNINKKKFSKKTIGIVEYGSALKHLQSIQINVNQEQHLDFFDMPSIVLELKAINETDRSLNSGKTLYITDETLKAASFSLLITFYELESFKPHYIELPLVNDIFNIKNASYNNEMFNIKSI